ncbi:unnamed protein product [Auanema sp. JU1783]|nr:unnamed protein product [Auanema sp. JU1783]
MDNAPTNPENSEAGEESKDDEELLLEPRLKYDRVVGEQAVKMLETEVITCISVNEKLVAIGSQSGRLSVMDHLGFSNFPVAQPHRSKVTRLELDPGGNFLISCGNDCRVVVTILGSMESVHVLNLTFMPRSVALTSDFLISNKFYVGERSLLVCDWKKLLKTQKVIYTGQVKDGHIIRCSCNKNYVAFTNDGGTRIYDKQSDRVLSKIPISHDPKLYFTAKCPPCHAWLSDDLIAIGWANTLTIAIVRNSTCDIIYSWTLQGFLCSGLSFIMNKAKEWSQIVFFGLKPVADDDDEDGKSMFSTDSLSGTASTPPVIQVAVLEPVSRERFRLVSEDSIALKVRNDSQPFQYQLHGMPSCDTYFLMGPDDFIMAVPYSCFDAVTWRVENNLWEEAWSLARERAMELEGTKYDMRTVGRGMVEYLIANEEAKLAANKCVEVCGKSKAEWEWAAGLFDHLNIATLLADVLPTNDPLLEPECYECVLIAALYSDISLFRKLVYSFNPDIYRIGSVIREALKRIQLSLTPKLEKEYALSVEDEMRLYSTIAHLYVCERNFKPAIKIYMDFKDPQVFRVLDRHNLFHEVKDKMSELMQINADLAKRLMLENERSLSPTFVMSKLNSDPKLEIKYLEILLSRNRDQDSPKREFADRAVRLYAEYERDKLLPFLKECEHYNLSKALEICRRKQYINEMILLLGKSGKHLEALDCMLRQRRFTDETHLKLGAITEKDYEPLLKAIEYCKEHDDMDLWNHLINKVLQSPHFISRLFREAGTSIDPLVIIEKIPVSMDIPDLRRAVAKVLSDCADRVNLLKGCRLATYSDSKELLDSLLKTQAKTKCVNIRSACFVCKMSVMNFSSTMLTFGCGHSAHEHCSNEMQKKLNHKERICYVCSEISREEFM